MQGQPLKKEVSWVLGVFACTIPIQSIYGIFTYTYTIKFNQM